MAHKLSSSVDFQNKMKESDSRRPVICKRKLRMIFHSETAERILIAVNKSLLFKDNVESLNVSGD